MNKITDNFCGYLNVGGDTFAYNVSNNLVTLLPAQVELVKRYEVLERILSYNKDSSEYLFGVADNNYRIAMLHNSKFSGDSLGFNPSIMFRTPVIIKASGNSDYFYNILTEDWDKFHSCICQSKSVPYFNRKLVHLSVVQSLLFIHSFVSFIL